MVCVAHQLGHDARRTLTTDPHVIDELDDQARVTTEDAIKAAHQTGMSLVAGPTVGGDAG